MGGTAEFGWGPNGPRGTGTWELVVTESSAASPLGPVLTVLTITLLTNDNERLYLMRPSDIVVRHLLQFSPTWLATQPRLGKAE